MIERYHGSELREKQLGFCRVVRAGGLVFVSGIVSWNDDFEPLYPGDMPRQMEQVYSTLAGALQQLGLGFANVVKETAFTTDISAAFGALAVRAAHFPDMLFPAATWVEVSRLAHPDLLLEVEVIAAS